MNQILEKPARAESASLIHHDGSRPSGKSAGAGTGIELEQAAAGAAGGSTPPAGDSRAVLHRPRLHYSLSIEHAALFARLTMRELELVVCLGKGWNARRIGEHMGITLSSAATSIRDLKRKTGLSRLSLSVMGYELSKQVEKRAA